MSTVSADGSGAVVVTAADAEVLGGGASTIRLLADGDATGGALSGQRVTLAEGANGAVPHFHSGSAEMFFVLSGRLQVLADDRVVTAGEGDFLVVPRKMPHAFAAEPGSPADVLVALTPGIARFDYFRLLDRVRRGEADPREILDTQQRFDNHFVDSPAWRAARPSA